MLLRNSVIFAIILAVFFFGLWLWNRDTPEAQGRYDSFAQCLASKNVTMYGSKTCSFCVAQQKKFGSSFKYVPYVECPENPQACISAGVEYTPTWIFPDGTKFVGDQDLDKLAGQSGCPLE